MNDPLVRLLTVFMVLTTICGVVLLWPDSPEVSQPVRYDPHRLQTDHEPFQFAFTNDRQVFEFSVH